MRSVLQKTKECYVCKATCFLHEHHVLYGTANRKTAEKFGLKVWLCLEHHTGNTGVHFNKDLDTHLKKYAQEYFEANIGDRERFRGLFGKSYL